MHLGSIWRYPVKSMAGERLERAQVGPLGLEGDRRVWVRNGQGRVITSRTHPKLLSHRGTWGHDGEAKVDGRPWHAPEVLQEVQAIVGPGAVLEGDDEAYSFDVLPLLIATDGALAAFGRDPRRLRPNLILEGVEGMAEREWPGRSLRIGEVVVRIQSVRQRCVMTTYDPDTQAQDVDVLKDIVRRFGGRLALDAEVVEGGVIEVGAKAELLEG